MRIVKTYRQNKGGESHEIRVCAGQQPRADQRQQSRRSGGAAPAGRMRGNRLRAVHRHDNAPAEIRRAHGAHPAGRHDRRDEERPLRPNGCGWQHAHPAAPRQKRESPCPQHGAHRRQPHRQGHRQRAPSIRAIRARPHRGAYAGRKIHSPHARRLPRGSASHPRGTKSRSRAHGARSEDDISRSCRGRRHQQEHANAGRARRKGTAFHPLVSLISINQKTSVLLYLKYKFPFDTIFYRRGYRQKNVHRMKS